MNAIEKIHQFNRFGSILGLERMTVLLEKLGDPHLELRAIHVAGTNGKGSVCKFLEEGLNACGYRTGLYTSPFIERFNERIRMAGEEISDEDLERYTDRVLAATQQMVAEGQDPPTEFEVVTAIALLYFQQKGADPVILEVGLGGSGDSTNVVPKPMACAISSISYDHMDRLGNTLTEIAGEKAGIIKPGVPVISNVADHEAAQVIARTAYKQGSKLYDVSKIRICTEEETPFSQKVSMELYGTDYSDVELSMVGKHQGENLKTALAVIEVLRKKRMLQVERGKLYDGLKKAFQPGRFEVVVPGNRASGEPMVILDGAHNAAGAQALKETAEKLLEGKRILMIIGVLADKQVWEILQQLTAITRDIVVTEPDNPRKLSGPDLAGELSKLGITAQVAADGKESIRIMKERQQDYDAVIFAGSLYLMGEVRRLLNDEQ